MIYNDFKSNASTSVIPGVIELSKPTKNNLTSGTGVIKTIEIASDESSRSPPTITNQLNPINIESEVDEIENTPQKRGQSEDLPQEFHEQFHKSLVHPTTETPPEQPAALSREERISPFNQNRRNNDFNGLSNIMVSSPGWNSTQYS